MASRSLPHRLSNLASLATVGAAIFLSRAGAAKWPFFSKQSLRRISSVSAQQQQVTIPDEFPKIASASNESWNESTRRVAEGSASGTSDHVGYGENKVEDEEGSDALCQHQLASEGPLFDDTEVKEELGTPCSPPPHNVKTDVDSAPQIAPVPPATEKWGQPSPSYLSPKEQQQMQQQQLPQPVALVVRKVRSTFCFCPCEEKSHINVEVQACGTSPYTFHRNKDRTNLTPATTSGEDSAEIQLDAHSVLPLLRALVDMGTSFGLAMKATIRLVGPMVFARGVLAYLAYGMGDWYAGRYLRSTYQRLENDFWRFQVPAVFRSMSRVLLQLLMTMLVGRASEHVLTSMYRPWCQLESGGCNEYFGLTWIFIVVSLSSLFGQFISNRSDSPLRIQVDTVEEHKPKNFLKLLRKWFLLQWMKDPDSAIRSIARKEGQIPLRPFRPSPLLFPVSWQPIRFLQIIAVTMHMPQSAEALHSMMFQISILEVLREEWYRVLVIEKRVALGVAVMALFSISNAALFFTAGESSGTSAMLLLPSLLAAILSLWMSVFLYFERRSKKPVIQQPDADSSKTNSFLSFT